MGPEERRLLLAAERSVTVARTTAPPPPPDVPQPPSAARVERRDPATVAVASTGRGSWDLLWPAAAVALLAASALASLLR
jgi:hypothetical protein